MKTAAILVSLAASAAAFAPASQQSTGSALQASKFAGEVGAQIPLGFWDPLSMVGAENQERFDRLREVEVKHGRIAMLAVVGYLSTYSGWRLEGMESMPSGLAALSPSAWQGNDTAEVMMLHVAATIWTLEIFVMKDHFGTGEFPGDYRNGGLDFGWDSFDEATKLRKRAIELNNGRAAQMGILGLMVHEQLGNVKTLLPLAL